MAFTFISGPVKLSLSGKVLIPPSLSTVIITVPITCNVICTGELKNVLLKKELEADSLLRGCSWFNFSKLKSPVPYYNRTEFLLI